MKKTKCLALFSGGLDSMIAVRLMAEQGVEVLAVHFDIGFGAKDDKSAIGIYKTCFLAQNTATESTLIPVSIAMAIWQKRRLR